MKVSFPGYKRRAIAHNLSCSSAAFQRNQNENVTDGTDFKSPAPAAGMQIFAEVAG